MPKKWEISQKERDRIFHDPAYQGYFREEMLDNQAPWFVPDEWRDDYDQWMAKDVRRKVFDLHADFLETLFGKDGYATLYRAMDTKGFKREGLPLPEPGDVIDIGQHWTYSGDADLTDAQISSSSKFDVVFKALVHFSQVDWDNTLLDHPYRHWHEKQIFVEGPVEILDVLSMSEFRRKADKISFDKWLKKTVGRPLIAAG